MATTFAGKKVLFGVSGGIAAYKAAGWVRELVKEGAEVTVVMTEAACRFVAPLTFAALSGRRVHTDMFDPAEAERIPHIALARGLDLMLVAPATANTIARLAHGLADDLLSTLALANRAPLLVFPAMNCDMYASRATAANLERLRALGYLVVEPDSGELACGDSGPGRLVEWQAAREAMLLPLNPQTLARRTVLVTAGPTWEPLDPVRHLSNRSTGKMGYALARTARRRGARVILVSGPTALAPPPGVELLRVETAAQMREAVLARVGEVDAVVKSAAVSDYRPLQRQEKKIKKSGAETELALALNPDILKELGQWRQGRRFPVLVGFAAESHAHLDEGRRKLREKQLDCMVVNDITASDAGFGVDTNRIVLLDREGGEERLPLLSKEEAAERIWDRVAALLGEVAPGG